MTYDLQTLLASLMVCLSTLQVVSNTITSASLDINVSAPIATTSPRFVSYTLDFPPSKKESSIATTSSRYVSFSLDWWPPNGGAPPIGWGHHANALQVDLNSPKLRALVSALGPSILRIGGTLEKLTEYDIPGQTSCSSTPTTLSLGYNRPCMPAKRWDALHEFAQATNSKIMFGLSYPQMHSRHYPNKDGTWNSSQAEALFRYSAAQNYSRLNTLYGFELGEELTYQGTAEFHNYVSSYHKCATLLRQIWNPKRQKSLTINNAKPKLLGPSPGMSWPTLATWFPAFLNATQGALDIAVYHSYNQIQSEPERIYYLNTTIPSGNLYNQTGSSPGDTGWQAVAMHKFVKDSNAHRKDRKHQPLELWLGEMGPHNGGGGDGTMSYSFGSSFAYLDSLGMLARLGHKVLARQTLVGGKYELLRCSTGRSSCDFEPHPDYWIALLWTRLMGTTVLEAPKVTPSTRKLEPLRFHAHCTASRTDGAVTLAVSNMSQNRTFVFQTPTGFGTSRVQYMLNGHDVEHAKTGFDARVLELNGIALGVGNSTKLPQLQGRHVKNDLQHPLVIPPVSIGFITFPDASAKACTAQNKDPYATVI